MSEITPFKGVRYSEKIKDYTKVITPPYDVITPEQQDAFYKVDENNIIRVDFGKDLDGDDEQNNKYKRAAVCLDDWIKSEILKKDDTPAYYVYYIDYAHPYTYEPKTLKGFFSLVKAEPFENGNILPHEHTFPKHKKDRLNLIRECNGNISAVFSIFSDKQDEVMTKLSVDNLDPIIEFQDSIGSKHRVWAVTDGIDEVTEIFKSKNIYIADGHHRYSTSVTYSQEVRGANPDDAGADYIMMFLANMDDSGVTILPTHRVLKDVHDKDWLVDGLAGKFDITPWKESSSLADFQAFLRKQEKHVFGIVFNKEDDFYFVKLKTSDKGLLDVEIFRQFIVEWVYSKDQIYSAENILYVKSADDVIDIVKKGDSKHAGFLLNAIDLDDMVRIVESGEKMPHKSTYFYPKPLTGLLLYKFDK